MNKIDDFRENPIEIIRILAIVLIAVLFINALIEKPQYLFIGYFLIALVFRIDSRYSIGATIVLLSLTAVLLVRENEDLANQMAIYAYYFLAIGVVLQLIEHITGKDVEEETPPSKLGKNYLFEKKKEIRDLLGYVVASAYARVSLVESALLKQFNALKTTLEGLKREDGGSEKIEQTREQRKARMREKKIEKIDFVSGTGAPPKFIAIASGKGGVGKTTISANLGVALSSLGNRVYAVEMDITMPNLEIIMGLKQPPVGLIDVINGILDIEKVTYLGAGDVRIIPSGIIFDGFTDKNIENIKDALRSIEDADFVVLDMPPGTEALKILKSNHDLLVVTNPEKASVLDALTLKTVALERGLNVKGIVLNRIGAFPNEMKEEDIEEVLSLDIIAQISEDKKVMISYNEEVPFILKYPKINPSKEVRRLAERLSKARD